ncbi:MAG: hypothetical protein KDK51_08805 [Deltaproteobacteria bacterium]|nr:hypothetical protein [Deltaproteobacteria bacterium]
MHKSKIFVFVVSCLPLTIVFPAFAQSGLTEREAVDLIQNFEQDDFFMGEITSDEIHGNWEKIYLGACSVGNGCHAVPCQGNCSNGVIRFEMNNAVVIGLTSNRVPIFLSHDHVEYDLIGGLSVENKYILTTPCKKFNEADVLVCRDSKIKNNASYFSIYERKPS